MGEEISGECTEEVFTGYCDASDDRRDANA
jgi:hypothetical protein